MFKLSNTIIKKTQRVTEGIDSLFKGLVVDINTEFKHSQTLISVVSHAPSYFAEKVSEIIDIKKGLLK